MSLLERIVARQPAVIPPRLSRPAGPGAVYRPAEYKKFVRVDCRNARQPGAAWDEIGHWSL